MNKILPLLVDKKIAASNIVFKNIIDKDKFLYSDALFYTENYIEYDDGSVEDLDGYTLFIKENNDYIHLVGLSEEDRIEYYPKSNLINYLRVNNNNKNEVLVPTFDKIREKLERSWRI